MHHYFTLICVLFAVHTSLKAITCTWTGSVNNDWHTAGNWNTGTVPTSADDVLINVPSKAANIANGNVGECNNITKGGFLSNFSISTGGLLKIVGNLTYNGGIFAGDVSFVGSSLQVIKGLSPLTLKNVTIANSNGVLMDGGNMKLSGTLSLQGSLYTNGREVEVNSISGYSSSVYVVIGDNLGSSAGSGGLKQNITAGGSAFFPIGASISSYDPVEISNTVGPNEQFTVGVQKSNFSADAVQRTWTISEYSSGDNTASITVTWDQSAEGSTFNRTSSGIYQSNGSAIVYTGYNPQVGAAMPAGGTTWSQTLTGVMTFADWIVNNNTGVLPITLIDFKVEQVTTKSRISWLIEVYSNPAYFEVEKSRDAIIFETLQKVPAQEGSFYQIEAPVDPGLRYYRLKMVDLDGEITYSKVLALEATGVPSTTYRLFPNPVQDITLLEMEYSVAEILDLKLYDQYGRLIWTKLLAWENGLQAQPIDLQILPQGLYFLRLNRQSGEKKTFKLIKK